jgi:hypothetical protein
LAAVENDWRILTGWIKRTVFAFFTAVPTLRIVDTNLRIRTAVVSIRINNGVGVVSFRGQTTQELSRSRPKLRLRVYGLENFDIGLKRRWNLHEEFFCYAPHLYPSIVA